MFLHKFICCGCELESPHRGDFNTHPKHMILWIIMVKTLVFCENIIIIIIISDNQPRFSDTMPKVIEIPQSTGKGEVHVLSVTDDDLDDVDSLVVTMETGSSAFVLDAAKCKLLIVKVHITEK